MPADKLAGSTFYKVAKLSCKGLTIFYVEPGTLHTKKESNQSIITTLLCSRK